MPVNPELTAQYNQLVWQMVELRNQAHEAGETYANKLKVISKKLKQVNDQLESVANALARQNGGVMPDTSPLLPQVAAAGFHP